jgi:hypothetical protein
MFVTLFTKARHLSLFWVRLRSVLTLCSHTSLDLPIGCFTLGFPVMFFTHYSYSCFIYSYAHPVSSSLFDRLDSEVRTMISSHLGSMVQCHLVTARHNDACRRIMPSSYTALGSSDGKSRLEIVVFWFAASEVAGRDLWVVTTVSEEHITGRQQSTCSPS